jgi:hypothetical protein
LKKKRQNVKRCLPRKIFHRLRETGYKSLAEQMRSGKKSLDCIKNSHQDLYKDCEKRVLNLELGKESFKDVFRSIEFAIGKQPNENLVVIGGPPCQAYSVVGRARQVSEKNQS